jgi:hypothetical protein
VIRLVCVPYVKCLNIIERFKQDVVRRGIIKNHYIVEIRSIYTDLDFFVLRNILANPGTAGDFLPETL